MKHILIVDLKDDTKCCGCPCYDDHKYCWAGDLIRKEIIDDIRPDDCPLRPMPHRKVPVFDPNRCDIEKEKVIMHEIDGWNNCLDEIGGEK